MIPQKTSLEGTINSQSYSLLRQSYEPQDCDGTVLLEVHAPPRYVVVGLPAQPRSVRPAVGSLTGARCAVVQ